MQPLYTPHPADPRVPGFYSTEPNGVKLAMDVQERTSRVKFRHVSSRTLDMGP